MLPAILSGALISAFAQTPSSSPEDLPAATDPATMQVAPGFKVDLLYTVPRAEQGSWVAMTVDPKGRLIVSDQFGGLYRVTVPPVGSAATTATAEPRTFSGAHGLLYAFDSLYVMVNEDRDKAGLWRLRDTNGDDEFDETTLLRTMKGSGEHGTHALILSPDGRSIYFANGNHTDLPENLEHSRAVKWGEDHVLPRMWDARGHAREKYAPGGYIGRTDPEGKAVELFALGFRNQYDLAFDQNGELFTYDSDMEWDQGTPWYMPTRINHVVDGGDYGWRSGAGRWPDYYADSLPAVIDIGPGSPTGLTFGTHAKFPAKYQRALFAADWTFGTLYAFHLTPDGATFRAEKEEFVAGKPLPLTDLLVNPHDGALYFAVGGRRTQSALYRVTYVGAESTAAAAPVPLNDAAKLRRSLEALHAEGTGPEAIEIAWPHLAHADRFIRFAARVAIERQPTERWAERALAETRPQAAIEALIALTRVGDASLQPRLIDALAWLDFGQQPAALRLPLLRAWQLAFTRMGKPTADVCARIVAQLDRHFPHADRLVNRELVALLVFLDSPTVVARAVPLLQEAEPAMIHPEELGGAALVARNDTYGAAVKQVEATRPDRQQIAYAYALRHATVGWTPQLRRDYFSWFSRTGAWRGGASFDGFLANIRSEALERIVTDPAERLTLNALATSPTPEALDAPPLPTPKGPGRAYTLEDALAVASGKLTGRNFEQGRDMFAATACVACHRFNDVGTAIGPDLSAAANRYNLRDLLENIIEPSRVISDQYGSERIEKEDGTTVTGRVVGEENGFLLVTTNPFTPGDHERVHIASVKSRQPHPVSLMPPGLIHALNEEELKDLLAYILSGGNANDPMFRAN